MNQQHCGTTVVTSRQYMGVSKNNGTPQIIHFNRVFHYKPSILGYHYFWKHPYMNIIYARPVNVGVNLGGKRGP